MSTREPVHFAKWPETPHVRFGDFGWIALVLVAIACVTVTAILWLDRAGIHLPIFG